MPKLYEIEPRFYVVGNLQIFDIPKGHVVVHLTRNKADGTLRLIARKVVKRKASAKKKKS